MFVRLKSYYKFTLKKFKKIIYERKTNRDKIKSTRQENLFLESIRKQNKNMNPSIICNNCVGGVIYHNLGLCFLSPTVNLSIRGGYYLEFCKHLKYYSQCEMVEKTDHNEGYPVGVIVPRDDDHKEIIVHFEHYTSFAEAKEKWCERFKRVNYDNVFYLWEFYDDMYDIELLQEFDALPVKKMAITHRKLDGIVNQAYVSCYEGSAEQRPFAKILQYVGTIGKRYLDEFDYVGFLNWRK